MLSKYEDAAQEFLMAHPIGAVVYSNDLLGFAEQRINGHALKADLALPDPISNCRRFAATSTTAGRAATWLRTGPRT